MGLGMGMVMRMRMRQRMSEDARDYSDGGLRFQPPAYHTTIMMIDARAGSPGMKRRRRLKREHEETKPLTCMALQVLKQLAPAAEECRGPSHSLGLPLGR